MIPGFDFTQFAQTAGPIAALLVVAAIIFSECGLMIGFFLPGDSILFTLGLLIQGASGFKLDININIAIFVLYIAATLGYQTGYLFGKKIGPRITSRPNSIFFHQKNVQRAQDFYNEYGGKTIILARFIPIVRTFVPLIAGVVRMRYRDFVMYNLVGGAIWITSVTYLGYFLGVYLESLGIEADAVLLPVIAAIILISVAPAIFHILKDKKQRDAIVNETKLQFKKIFKINKKTDEN